jgi:endonuclease-3 related protein
MQKIIQDIYEKLFGEFGYQNWWPIVRDGKCYYEAEFRKRKRSREEILEIMIGAVLTQNTSWDNAVKAISGMKKAGFLSLDKLLSIDEDGFSRIIKESGYYMQKSKKIKALSLFLHDELCDDVSALSGYGLDKAREMLLSVWGIGNETADSILLYGYYYPVFVIDAYTRRIFSRIGVEDAYAAYEELQSLVHDSFKPDRIKYQEYHADLVMLGKSICRKEPLCGECFLSFMCCFAKSRTAYAQKRT